MLSTTNTLHHVEYAMGYIALNLFQRAAEELAAVDESEKSAPEVLAARAELYLQSENWPELVDAAQELASRQPQSDRAWLVWAYALRALGRTGEACAVLRKAARWHGKESATLHYHLACYCALSGNCQSAREELRVACAIDPAIRFEAAEDPDLAALWSEVAAAA